MLSNRVKGIGKALKDMKIFASGRFLESGLGTPAPERPAPERPAPVKPTPVKPAERGREKQALLEKPHPGVMEELEKLLDSFII